MNKKLKIGIIFGGRSGEHEVSLVSAESVIKAIDKKKYQIVPIGITKEGKWLATGDPMKALKTGKSKGITQEVETIINPTKKGFLRTAKGTIISIDVVFPVLHGTYGEDGAIQGLFEMANIPYVGSRVLGSAVGMDKVIQKQILRDSGLPIVDFDYFYKFEWEEGSTNILRRIEKQFKYPLFVKPANMGSSVGISKAKNKKSLTKSIKEAFKYDTKIIVEKALEEVREIECSILGNNHPEASLPGEVVASGEFYDYNAKYIDGKSKTVIPAKLSPSLIDKIQDFSIKTFQILNLCGMARIDFFIAKPSLISKTAKIYINEVNTIPGFTAISMYPKLWEASGMPYKDLINKLVRLSTEKHREKMNLLNSFIPKSDWYK